MARKKLRREARVTGEAIIPDYMDTDLDAVQVMPDGRVFQRQVFGLTEAQVERIRLGYVCIKCLEALDIAFPDQCPVCRFPMRERQAEEFAKDYRGGIRFGPATTIEEEMDIMDELRERQTRERARELGIEIATPSIIVPRDL